jgi:hypothetical protein
MTNVQFPAADDRFNLKQRTKSFSLRIIKMFTALPKNAVARVLGEQVLRSGTSVGANYREADAAGLNSSLKWAIHSKNWLKQSIGSNYWWKAVLCQPPKCNH